MKRTEKKGKRAWKILCGIVGGLAMLAAAVALVMWLWNILMPGIAGFKAITFWQALGIFVLCRLLTGRLFPHHHPDMHRKGNARHDHWHKMSPQQRKEMIRRYWDSSMEPGNKENGLAGESGGEK